VRIAVTDGIDKNAKLELEELGHHVEEEHYSKEELLEGCISDFDIIIVRSATKLTSEVIKANTGKDSSLSMIIRAGVGIDNIDLTGATENSVLVCNTPGSSTNAVVEMTMGHLISSNRLIIKSDRMMRKGFWAKKELRGSELRGKNLGLLGYGRIARGVAEIAKKMGMKIHVFDPYLSDYDNECVYHDKVEDLFSNCTHISIHCYLSEETRHLVNSKLIKLMPKVGADGINCGNHIVNCARGGIIDESDLHECLVSGHLSTASLDVFEVEPVLANELLNLENFQATPHIGASTYEAQSRIGKEIVSIVSEFSNGDSPKSCLN
tara:strand:- start:6171 stop:7136 length:966 start_codon:yes stop_codon:yes gene_type:complete